jgi:hypothetical protein
VKLSEAVKKLVDELATRGDCELVTRIAPGQTVWVSITDIEVYKTPYTAPAGTGYLEFTQSEP